MQVIYFREKKCTVLCTSGPYVSAINGQDCRNGWMVKITHGIEQSGPLIVETDGPDVHSTIPNLEKNHPKLGFNLALSPFGSTNKQP